LKSGPQKLEKQLTERRQFKLSLNPTIHKVFKLRCRLEKRKPNIVIEDFMLACLKYPRLIDLIEHIVSKISQRD